MGREYRWLGAILSLLSLSHSTLRSNHLWHIRREFSQYSSGWIQEDKNYALAHLKAIESFEFIYTLVTLQRSLLYLKETLIKLQGINQDIASGLNLID